MQSNSTESEVTLTREELYQMVWSKPMAALAKEFAISDVGLRKVCKRLQVPIPQMGYWNKVKAGKKVSRPKLEDDFSGEQTVALKRKVEGQDSPTTAMKNLQTSIQNDRAVNVKVPAELTNPHPLIIAAKKDLAEKHEDWKFEGMIFTMRGVLSIRVTPALVDRALRFMDTLVKAFAARGHVVSVDQSGSYVTFKGRHKMEIGCRETTTRVKEKNSRWDSFEYRPTKQLAFKARYFDWKDTHTKKLEEQIPAIIAKLEDDTARLFAIWADNDRRETERKKTERLVLEDKQRQQNELNAVKSLLARTNRWRQAETLRQFLLATENTEGVTDGNWLQ